MTLTLSAKPRITLCAQDYEKLTLLADAAMKRMPDLAAELSEELGRAEIIADGDRAHDAVQMNSAVEFRDDTSGKTQTLTLVYPEDADIAQGKISILTPVGTALLGLRRGQSITWETRGGDIRSLTVLAVRQPQA